MDYFIPYEELKRINSKYTKVFILPEGKKQVKNYFEVAKPAGANRFHPTQKPVDLLIQLIELYTRPGDTVLDFTMGSGSTGVACALTGRNFIGIELDDEYFEIAKKRIAEVSK